MSDYVKEYAWKLFGDPLNFSLTTAGILTTAAMIAMPLTDDVNTEKFLGIFPTLPTQEQQFEESQMPWERELERIKREAEEFARNYTPESLNTPRSRTEFLTENRYTEEQCKKCSLLDNPGTQKRHEIAGDFSINPYLADAVAYQESNMSHKDKSGKPKRSNKGAYGEFQITYKGFSEVWKIINEDKDNYYKSYLDKHRDSIRKYAPLFRGDKLDVWERVKNVEKMNRVAGIIFTGFNIHKENGDKREALRNYGAGKSRKLVVPNEANKYASSVLGHRDFFENTCPAMKSRYRAFEKRRYQTHKSNHLAANQGY